MDVSALPPDVPLGLVGSDRVDRVRAFEDGRRWLVSVNSITSGGNAYANAKAALVAAGFAVTTVDAVPFPNAWATTGEVYRLGPGDPAPRPDDYDRTWGEFSRGDMTVHVDQDLVLFVGPRASYSNAILIVRAD